MLPTTPGAARRLLGALATCFLAVLLVTCGESPISPRGMFRAAIAVVPRYEANARFAPLVIDQAEVVVTDLNDKELVRVRQPFTGDQARLTAQFELAESPQDVIVQIILSAGDVVLFQGSQRVTVTKGVPLTPAEIPVTYFGPGADAEAVTIAPRDTVVQPGGVFTFHPRAFNVDAELTDFYVRYTLVNPPAGVTLTPAGVFTAPSGRDTVLVRVEVLPSLASDSTRVIVIPAPASLIKQGGDNQSGSAGSRLGQLLAVRVNGSDGQPVPGVNVAFAVAGGGGSVDSASATTDASGIARSGAVLGSTVGAQSFTATVSGVTPATFTATATAPTVTAVPLAASGDHTCEIRGVVTYCWGDNSTGALGDGTTTNRLVATQVAGATTFIALALGNSHSCALTAAGAAQCWGDNSTGELGDGTGNTPRAFPQSVAGGHTFLQLAAGDRHTCGLTAPGDVFCWGLNSSGQLGTGTTISSNVPVQVSGASFFKAISAEGNHTCALSVTGAAFCWGLNSNGELGDGTLVSRSVPTPVSGGLTFTAISVGNRSSCAIATGGTGYCWGFNFGAQLTAPTQVGGGFSYTALDMGGDHICGLTSGGWRCGGRNASGQLGDGTTTDAPAPVLPSGGFTYSAVAGGASHTCGITSSGTRCWGLNTAGQLGSGSTSQQLTPTPSRGPVASVAVNAGNGQSVTAGSAVPTPPSVVVRDGANAVLPGVEVIFAVTAGGGTATGTTTLTNASGIATVGSWTTGATPGSNSLSATATAPGVTGNPVIFTATGTVPTITLTWTGAVSTNFAVAGNWSPAVAPSATSDIVIVAATNTPVLGSNLTVKSLTVSPGGTFDIGFNTLNVGGSVLIDGTLNGGGAIQITGAGQVRGSLAQLVILAPVTAAGNVTTSAGNNLNISAGGDFSPNGHSITVGGSISTSNGGFLTMTNSADQVSAINATFGGGDEAGRLTAGVISLTGSLFTVGNTPANRGPLDASGLHTFVFLGTGDHLIEGLAGATQVSIRNLNISNTTGKIGLTTQTATPLALQIGGSLTARPSISPVSFHGLPTSVVQASSVNISRLGVDSIRFIVGQPGGVITQFDSVAFTNQDPTLTQLTVSHPGAATPFTFTALSFSTLPGAGRYLAAVDEAPADGQVLTINMAGATPSAPPTGLLGTAGGAVINWPPTAPTPQWTGSTNGDWSVGSNWSTGSVPGPTDSVVIPVTAVSPSLSDNFTVGAVQISGGTLTINGHVLSIARTLMTSGTGTLTMTNPADLLLVGGNAIFNGGSTSGLLTAGTLRIAGSFSQLSGSSTQSFAATSPHTVAFLNNNPQIAFASPGANASHFGRLSILFGSTATLGSDVYVAGLLTGSEGAAGVIKGTCGKTLTVQTLSSSGITFDCISLIVDDPSGTGSGLNALTFVNQVSGATQIALIHPGPSYQLSNVTFNPLAAGAPGLYLTALDFTSGTTPLVVNVVSNNPGNGPAFTATSGGAVVIWPTTTATWLGTTSTDFSAAANWSGGIAPTISSNVVIPAGTPFSPVLTATTFINNLTIGVNGVLSLGDFPLGVGGSLANDGQILSPGQNAGLVLMGTGQTLRGVTGSSVSLVGSYTLDGRTFVGVDTLPKVFAITGSLDLGGHTLQVTGDFATSGTGTLTMTQATDSLMLSGGAVFNGGSTSGLMTNGTLIVGGELLAILGSTTAFAPSGAHVTVMTGATAIPGIQFSTPGTGAAGSHFATLDLSQMDSEINLASDVFIDGTLIAAANSAQFNGAGHTVTSQRWQVDRMAIQNTTMVLDEGGVQRPQQFDNVTFIGFPATGATQMRVIMQGGSSSARTVTFTGLQFESKATGSGSFYVDATANVPTGLILNLPASNQGAGASGNGPALTRTTGSVTVNWP